MPKIPQLLYRVWEAELVPDGTRFLVAVSSVREPSLREEMAQGKLLGRLVRVVAETPDRNKARELSNGAEA